MRRSLLAFLSVAVILVLAAGAYVLLIRPSRISRQREQSAAQRIEAALEKVYREASHVTRDLGGKATTAEFTDAVISALSPVAAHSS